MTVHNLEEHLTWLIASVPSNLPSSGLAAISKNPSSWGCATINEDALAINSNLNEVTECYGANFAEVDESSFPLASTSAEEANTMAKLQSGSRSTTKSRLLTEGAVEVLRTPKPQTAQPSSTSLRDVYSAPYDCKRPGISFPIEYAN